MSKFKDIFKCQPIFSVWMILIKEMKTQLMYIAILFFSKMFPIFVILSSQSWTEIEN